VSSKGGAFQRAALSFAKLRTQRHCHPAEREHQRRDLAHPERLTQHCRRRKQPDDRDQQGSNRGGGRRQPFERGKPADVAKAELDQRRIEQRQLAFVSKCFMIGKLRPHPTDATASRMSPSGDSRPERLIGGVAGLDPEPGAHLFSF
jgi:hypothetical protein